MDEKDSDRPLRTLRKNHSEPGGVSVKSCSYKVVVRYGDLQAEQTITVVSDPGLEISDAAIDEEYTAAK